MWGTSLNDGPVNQTVISLLQEESAMNVRAPGIRRIGFLGLSLSLLESGIYIAL